MPEDAELDKVLARSEMPGPASFMEPYHELVTDWARQGIQSNTIYRALAGLHRFRDSYDSVKPRFVRSLGLKSPKATICNPPLLTEIISRGLRCLRQPSWWNTTDSRRRAA